MRRKKVRSDLKFKTMRISAQPSGPPEGETEVLADDEGHILVVWMDGSPADNRIVTLRKATSSNGGKTFGKDEEIDAGCILLDPSLARDERGNIYLSALRNEHPDDYSELSVVLYRSRDFGVTWTKPPFIVSDAKVFNDRPWIAAENDGTLHIVYGRRLPLPDGNVARPVLYQQSLDGGRTFSEDVLVNPPFIIAADSAGGSPRGIGVTADGRIVVGYQQIPKDNKSRNGAGTFPGPGGVFISRDGGRNFGPPILFTTPQTLIADAHGNDVGPEKPKFLKPFPRIKCFENSIYVIWVGNAPKGKQCVYVSALHEGRVLFEPPVVLAIAPAESFILPTLAIDSSRKIHAFWFGQDDDARWTLFSAQSTDEGHTFKAPRQITDISFEMNRWPGDFINAVAAPDGQVFVPWEAAGGSQPGVYLTIGRNARNDEEFHSHRMQTCATREVLQPLSMPFDVDVGETG